MNIKDGPHFRVHAKELAAWIKKQGEDRWWNVDGDPLLTGRIAFPSPGDELATELEKINRVLLVEDKQKRAEAIGQEIKCDALDSVVDRLKSNAQNAGRKPAWLDDRFLYLCWDGTPNEWLLVEDEETSESSLKDFAASKKKE